MSITSVTPTGRRRDRARLLAAAAVFAGATGLGALALLGPEQASSPLDTTAGQWGDGLSRSAAVELCLDIESEFDLDSLRASGTVHRFGEPSSGELPLVISSSALHVGCGLAQRGDGQWIRVIALANTHQPLANVGQANVLTQAELQGQVYITGLAGSAVADIEVEVDGTTYTGRIDDGWWGVSFPTDVGPTDGAPAMTVTWTTTGGQKTSAAGSDLVPPSAWSLCAGDVACRAGRLTELQEQAKALPDPEQAEILADGVVSDAEYRAMFRTWGNCIAEASGATLTFDDDGKFTAIGDAELIQPEFERCQ